MDWIFDKSCERCNLCNSARSVCVGNRGKEEGPKLIIIGEAPGKEEDVSDTPFIGKAAQLLDSLMKKAGINEDDVLYTNVVRCFPHENGITKQPTEEEVDACIPYLYAVLSEISKDGSYPMIVALGNVALEALTGLRNITKNRGIEFNLVVRDAYKDVEEFANLKNFKVIGTIHPSAVLRGQSAYEPKIITDLGVAWKKATGNFKSDYDKDYVWVDDPLIFEFFVDEAIKQYQAGEIKWVAYDLETTGLGVYDKSQKTVAFSMCKDPGKALVIPLHHKDSPWKEESFIMDRVLKDLGRLLSSVPVCGWNLSFDIKWTWVHLGLDFFKVGFDGLLSRKWLNPSKEQNNDLNSVSADELGFVGHGREIWAEINTLPKEIQHMGNVSKNVLLKYAGGDADATFRLCNSYFESMNSVDGNFENFDNLILRGLIPVCKMEYNGVFIDRDMNSYLMDEYPRTMEPHIQIVENSVWGSATKSFLAARKSGDGKPAPLAFNLKSDVTLRNLIYSQMELPAINEKKTGPSTDRETLETLSEVCNNNGWDDKKKVLENINEWRALSHTYSNFIKNMPEYTAADGFFHTQYNIMGTESGRFSSYKPSIHGQPKGSKARWQFISRWPHGVLLSADMSQMEMRILASLSGDESLIASILSGVDIHTSNASRMFKVPIEEVTKKQRDKAKRAGFGVVYGIGAQTLAARIETSVEESQAIINAWYDAFPKTWEYQEKEWKTAKKYGCVITDFGRVRWIDGIKTSKWGDRQWRQAINNRIQSQASDVTYSSLLEIYFEIEKQKLQSLLFGFVHDAIIVDVFPGELLKILDVQYSKMVKWTNETFEWMKAPVSADFEIGASWGFPCPIKNWENNKITVTGEEAGLLLLASKLSVPPDITKLEDGTMEMRFEYEEENEGNM